MINALTIDLEDYFQVSAFESVISREKWHSLPYRVEKNTNKLLELLDNNHSKATFFILGWVAQKSPGLIRKIDQMGHEIASHSFDHRRVNHLTPIQFKEDCLKSKSILEDLSGKPVIGYRAPTFSISHKTPWAHPILEELGFTYSSSVYPIKHDAYGWPGSPRFPYIATPNGLLEIPQTTAQFGRLRVPCAGGGYFRLYPYVLSHYLIDRVNVNDKQPCIFYLHPWELDPLQPKQKGIRMTTRMRHYLNLSRMQSRLERLLKDFQWKSIYDVFIETVEQPRRVLSKHPNQAA